MSSEDESPVADGAKELANVLSIKLPPFTEENPIMWFALIESQFHIRGIIHDAAKFYHAISALQPSQQAQVVDVMQLPVTSEDKYDKLKTRLTKTYGKNKIDRAMQIYCWPSMSEEERPSRFINKLRAICSDDISPDHPLFWACILGKLPQDISEKLRVMSYCNDWEQMAEFADQIWLSSRNRDSLHVLMKNKGSFKAKNLQEESNTNGICPWHAKFGTKAWSCRTPCKFSSLPRERRNGNKLAAIEFDIQGNEKAGNQ